MIFISFPWSDLMVTSAAYRFNPIWGYSYLIQQVLCGLLLYNNKIICLLRAPIIVGIIYVEGFLPVIPIRRLDASGLREGWTPCSHRGRAILHRPLVPTATLGRWTWALLHILQVQPCTLITCSLWKINRSHFVSYVSIINFCNLRNLANAVKLFQFSSNYLLLLH